MRLFEMDGVKLSFDKQVLDFIVEQAMEYQLGARGLRSICEAILLDAMFEIPNNKDQKEFKVTLTYAKEQFGKSKISKLKVA
jgi:ATP-dependent Clp protease ATP-binding subunit ClpX